MSEHSDIDRKNRDRKAALDEKLERALEDSMDASDPPSHTRPGDKGEPSPSSGFKQD